MDSPFNKPITDFINHFNLLNPDGIKSFEGRILYIVKGVPHEYKCTVTIVTIRPKKLDAIYLLDDEIKSDGFEDMFVIKDEKINYIESSCLLIERDKNFKVFIFPLHVNNAL